MPDWAWVHRELRRPDVTLGAAVGGVSRRRARRVRLFLVLRSVPGLGRPAEADDAPDPCRRREAVRRFRRPHRRGRRWPHRRDHPGADLRRRPGRVELHLCRGGVEPEAAGLDRRACPRLCVFRRRRPADGQRQSEGRHHQGLASTSRWSIGPMPTWRGITAPRSSRRGPTSPGTRPKSRSGCRWSGAGFWRGCGTGASSRWPNSTRRSAPCSTRSTTARCAAGARAGGRSSKQLDRPALVSLPPFPYEYAEWKRCRVNLDYHVEIAKHYYSVPHQLIRQEVEARITADDGRDLPPRQARRQPPPQPATAPADHRRRTHAQFAPALSRLDARAHPPRGRSSRPRRRRAGRCDLALAAASRAGLPLLHRHPAPGQALWRRTGRCRLRPCAGARHPLLQLGRRNPEEPPRAYAPPPPPSRRS